jgi:hypothetical protein
MDTQDVTMNKEVKIEPCCIKAEVVVETVEQMISLSAVKDTDNAEYEVLLG